MNTQAFSQTGISAKEFEKLSKFKDLVIEIAKIFTQSKFTAIILIKTI